MDVKSVIEKNIVIVMKKRPNKASSFCLYMIGIGSSFGCLAIRENNILLYERMIYNSKEDLKMFIEVVSIVLTIVVELGIGLHYMKKHLKEEA